MFLCQCSDARAAGVIHRDQGYIHLFIIYYVYSVYVCVGGAWVAPVCGSMNRLNTNHLQTHLQCQNQRSLPAVVKSVVPSVQFYPNTHQER